VANNPVKAFEDALRNASHPKTAILDHGPVGRVLNKVWNRLHDIQSEIEKTDQDYQDAAHFSGRPATKDAQAMIKKIQACVADLNTLTHKTLNELAEAEAEFVKKHGEPGDYSDKMRAEIFPG
jgi:hypothetical protein